MKKITEKQCKFLKDHVFDFYVKNKNQCNRAYELAEDPNIKEIYETITDESIKNILYVNSTIVILTANKYEKNILHKRVFDMSRKKIKSFRINLLNSYERYSNVSAYYFEISNCRILHIHTLVTGSYTIGGSADVIRWIISNELLFPDAIISFGICFGTKEKSQNLGDVIISKKIYPYFVGAKVNGQKLSVIDDNNFSTNSNVTLEINNLFDNNMFKQLNFDVKYDNYLTGEAVVSSSKERKKFLNITTQPIFAGDMEGYGLYKECNSLGYSIPCFIIKSICDWGIEKNFDIENKSIINVFLEASKDNGCIINEQIAKKELSVIKDVLQAYSANCAFEVLKILIENNIFKNKILSYITEFIINYNGAATTCSDIEKQLINVISNLNRGYKMNKKYLHHIILLLSDIGLIECSTNCLSQNAITDFSIECDESIKILGK